MSAPEGETAPRAASGWQTWTPPEFGGRAIGVHFAETWRSRALLWVLTQREIKGRYRGSVLGFGWTLLNPLLLLAVYSLVFAFYMRLAVPRYPLFVLSGLLPWLWLAQSLVASATSLTQGGVLISKVMLPPQVIPTAQLAGNAINFALTLPVLWLAALVVGAAPGLSLMALPLVVAAQAAFLLGLVLAISSLCVVYRDVQFLVNNLVTFWFFLTPIAYPPDLVPAFARPVLWANPFAPFAVAYQDVLYRGVLPPATTLLAIVAYAAISLVAGVLVFEKIRPQFVEEL